nr:hypothetical protein [Bacillota bacterium]
EESEHRNDFFIAEICFGNAEKRAYFFRRADDVSFESVALAVIGRCKFRCDDCTRNYLFDEYMGDVMGDLNSRRGMIKEMEAVTGAQRITAYVPLSEMFGYATDLRSKTQGRGQYSMEPSHYSEVPKSIQEKIINDRSRNNG